MYDVQCTMCCREVVGGVSATAGGKEREREVIKKWEERALSTSHTHPPTPSPHPPIVNTPLRDLPPLPKGQLGPSGGQSWGT